MRCPSGAAVVGSAARAVGPYARRPVVASCWKNVRSSGVSRSHSETGSAGLSGAIAERAGWPERGTIGRATGGNVESDGPGMLTGASDLQRALEHALGGLEHGGVGFVEPAGDHQVHDLRIEIDVRIRDESLRVGVGMAGVVHLATHLSV